MNPDLAHAILALEPKAKFQIIENDINQIDWQNKDISKPSNKTIELKLKELQAEYEANQYQRDRAVAYPSIQDVVVALAEKEEGNDAMWQEITAKRAKVKSDNPKPE
mgnify:CR=1 FL=1